MAFSESLGSAVIEVRASTDKLRQGLKKAEAQVQSSSQKMVQYFGGLRTIVLGVSAAMGALGLAALNSFGQVEKMLVGFESMLGSKGAAKQLVDELKEFSARTPFQLSDISSAARQLLAAGTSVEDLRGQLKLLGDVAAGANIPLNDMSSIMAKVQNKGKAMTEELLQMSDRGIPIIQALADQFGVTKEEIFKMGEQGKITADVVQEALKKMSEEGGIYFDQMNKQADTLQGKWSTFKDVLVLFGAEIGELLAPIAKAFLTLTTGILNGLTSVIDKIKSMMSYLGRIEGATSAYQGALKQFNVEQQTAIESTQEQTEQLKEQQGEIEKTTSATDKTTSALEKQEKQTRSLERASAKSFSAIANAASSTASSMSNAFSSAFSNLGQAIGGDKFGGVLAPLLGAVGDKLFGEGGSFSGVFDSIGSGIGNFFGGFFAEGGRPPMNKVSVIGEKGPELFVPDSAGTVIPNHALGSSNNVSVNLQPIFVGVDAQIQQKINQATPQIVNQAKNAVSDAINRGDKKFRGR